MSRQITESIKWEDDTTQSYLSRFLDSNLLCTQGMKTKFKIQYPCFFYVIVQHTTHINSVTDLHQLEKSLVFYTESLNKCVSVIQAHIGLPDVFETFGICTRI